MEEVAQSQRGNSSGTDHVIEPGLRNLRYEERVEECGLTTLESQRFRGYQIKVVKILDGYENIYSNFFSQN